MRPCCAALLLLMASWLPATAQPDSTDAFVRIEDGRFVLHGKPYYFTGVNLWYGMHLGIPDERGDRPRLVRELDHLQRLGVDNLRIMGSAEGTYDGWQVVPALQPEPGVYDAALLQGLDFFLAEMAKRDMKAVVTLNNFFMWSGGFAQYVSWVRNEPIPYPGEGASWNDFMSFAAEFFAEPEAQALYFDFVRMILHRVNHLTGVAYKDDPTIMSWQLVNEPRSFTHAAAYYQWVQDLSALIRSEAPNQLISLGGEGKLPVPSDNTLFEATGALPTIDYLTCHLWIQNWGWFQPQDPATLGPALGKAVAYLADHVMIADTLNKPLVLEEFGLARDSLVFEPDGAATTRDVYYGMMYESLLEFARLGYPVAGSNVWGWSGEGRAVRPGGRWAPGEPLTGDPPHEQQGWYGLYDTDTTTLALLADYAAKMRALGLPPAPVDPAP